MVRNGGFDSATAWNTTGDKTDDRQNVPVVGSDLTGMVRSPLRHPPATVVEGGNPGGCLQFSGPGDAMQDVLVIGDGTSLTAALDVWVKDVQTQPGEDGHAYATICQTDAGGRIVAKDEFVHLTGTHPWQRYSHTFHRHPEAEFVSLRCGLSQAAGVARFDNWTLVVGEQAKRLDEVHKPALRPDHPGGTVAILYEPGMATQGAASSAKNIANILDQIGMKTRCISAAQLANPAFFNVGRFGLLVLPTGRTFPAEARLA